MKKFGVLISDGSAVLKHKLRTKVFGKPNASNCIHKPPRIQLQGLQIAGSSQSNNYNASVKIDKRYHINDIGHCKKVIDSCSTCNKRIIRSHICIIILGSETKYKPTSIDVQDIVLPTRKCTLVREFGDSETKDLNTDKIFKGNHSVTPLKRKTPLFTSDCIAKQSKNKINNNKSIYNQNLFFRQKF
jgi:hypothetical protein